MASRGASALTGAGIGAAGGTAVMPGIGTAIGAVGGAVGGYLLGDDPSSGGASYSPNQNNFQYGLGPMVNADGTVYHPSDEQIAAHDQAYQKRLAEINAQRAQVQAQLNQLGNDNSLTGNAARAQLQKQLDSYGDQLKQLDATLGKALPEGQDSFAAQRTRELVGSQGKLNSLIDDTQSRTGPTQQMPGSIDFKSSDGQAYLARADEQSRAQQLAALGGIQSQTAALNTFAQAPEGPSAAQAQLQAGTDMAARQQYGFARSQPGGGGSALRGAAFNAAGISGNAANTAAMLRAQETQAYRAQQLQALGAAQQGATASAGAAGQLRGADQSLGAAKAGQANYDAGAQNTFNQGQQQLQFSVGQNNLNAGLQTQSANDAFTLGLTGASQGYDALRGQVVGADVGQGNAYESARAQGAGLGIQGQSVNNAQSNAETGMALGALSSGIGAYANSQQNKPPVASSGNSTSAPAPPTSDVRAKKDIRRADVLAALSGAADGARSNLPATEYPTMPADTRFHGSHADFATDLRPAQGYEYSYKDPATDGAGRYVGPMAQDLEHLPGVVTQGADGKKAIDAPRLTLANTAAVSAQQRRLDELERNQRLQALGGPMPSSGFVRPDVKQPDYAAYGAPGYHY